LPSVNLDRPICSQCSTPLQKTTGGGFFLGAPGLGVHYAASVCMACQMAFCVKCLKGRVDECPICGTRARSAWREALIELNDRVAAAARGEELGDAYALVISPMTYERAEAIEWFDAIVSSSVTPPYPFDLVVAEGPEINRTVLICFFDSSKKGAPKPLEVIEDSIHGQFLPWLKAAGGRTWYDTEFHGPDTYRPGDLKLEKYFGGIHILRRKTIGASA